MLNEMGIEDLEKSTNKPEVKEGEVQTSSVEEEFSPESERPFDFHFYVTDHSADYEDTGNPEKLKESNEKKERRTRKGTLLGFFAFALNCLVIDLLPRISNF